MVVTYSTVPTPCRLFVFKAGISSGTTVRYGKYMTLPLELFQGSESSGTEISLLQSDLIAPITAQSYTAPGSFSAIANLRGVIVPKTSILNLQIIGGISGDPAYISGSSLLMGETL